jgi:hypothetical protein
LEGLGIGLADVRARQSTESRRDSVDDFFGAHRLVDEVACRGETAVQVVAGPSPCLAECDRRHLLRSQGASVDDDSFHASRR